MRQIRRRVDVSTPCPLVPAYRQIGTSDGHLWVLLREWRAEPAVRLGDSFVCQRCLAQVDVPDGAYRIEQAQ